MPPHGHGQDERVGDTALAGAERAGDGGRDAATHAARYGVLDQHHEREAERDTRKRIRIATANKQSVKRRRTRRQTIISRPGLRDFDEL